MSRWSAGIVAVRLPLVPLHARVPATFTNGPLTRMQVRSKVRVARCLGVACQEVVTGGSGGGAPIRRA